MYARANAVHHQEVKAAIKQITQSIVKAEPPLGGFYFLGKNFLISTFI